jgi:hypothetical protein
MAGSWAGGGTVTLDDGSKERIRCRASYAVAGPSMDMTLTCASDAYKFNLQASVVDQAVRSRETGPRRAATSAAASRAAAVAAISRWSPVPPASTPTSRSARLATSSPSR